MDARIPIKDIKKIAIVQTDRKMTLDQVVLKYGCQYAINGGLYNTTTGRPNCWLKVDGTIVARDAKNYGYWSYGWDIGPDIKMIHSNAINSVDNLMIREVREVLVVVLLLVLMSKIIWFYMYQRTELLKL